MTNLTESKKNPAKKSFLSLRETENQRNERLFNLIKEFLDEDGITDVVKHINSITADAIGLCDDLGEPFYTDSKKVSTVENSAKIVNFLVEASWLLLKYDTRILQVKHEQ